MPLLEAQRSRRLKVEVACSELEPFVNEIREKGFTVNSMPMPPDGRYFHPVAIIRSILWLARLIQDKNFQVVHTHQPMGSVLGVMATRLARPSLVIHTTGGLKTVTSANSLSNHLFGVGERALLNWTDAVFSVNKADVALMTEKWGFPINKVFYVGPRGGCGIDVQHFDCRMRTPEAKDNIRASLGLPSSGKIVGTVARLVWEKGFDELLHAARDLLDRRTGLTFLVVGEGPHDMEIQTLAQQLGIAQRMIFTGRRSDVPRLLAIMDVFVLPSYREGFPIAATEAMVMGLPVVGTRVRGLDELVLEGKTGFLIPVGDSNALADAIHRLLEDEKLARSMGIAGRKRVVEEFSTQILLTKQMELYQQLIESALQGTDIGH